MNRRPAHEGEHDGELRVVDHSSRKHWQRCAEFGKQLADKRGSVDLFDFGGTVEDIKARCKAETGMEPPKPPVFQSWHRA